MARSLLLSAIAGAALVITLALIRDPGEGAPVGAAARASSAPLDHEAIKLEEVRDGGPGVSRVNATAHPAPGANAAAASSPAPTPAGGLEVDVSTRFAARRPAGHAVALVLKGPPGGTMGALVLDRARTDDHGLATLGAEWRFLPDGASLERVAVRLEEPGFVGYDAQVNGLEPGDPRPGRARVKPFRGFVQPVQVVDGRGQPIALEPEVSSKLASRVERITGIPTIVHIEPGLADLLVVNDPRGHVIVKDPGLGYGELYLPDLLEAGPTQTPVAIEVARWAILQGRLLNAFGEALPDVPLKFGQSPLGIGGSASRHLAALRTATVRTDEGGRFRVEGLAEGGYMVTCPKFAGFNIDFLDADRGEGQPSDLVWHRVWVDLEVIGKSTAPAGTVERCWVLRNGFSVYSHELEAGATAAGHLRCLLEPGEDYEAVVRETRPGGHLRERRIALRIPQNGAVAPVLLRRPDHSTPWIDPTSLERARRRETAR